MDRLIFLAAAWPLQSSHLELLGALIISLITALVTWRKSKGTEHTSQFTVFMKESANYREELRHEQRALKEQLAVVIADREATKAKFLFQTSELEKVKEELEEAKIEIKLLTEKVRQLKELQIIINES